MQSLKNIRSVSVSREVFDLCVFKLRGHLDVEDRFRSYSDVLFIIEALNPVDLDGEMVSSSLTISVGVSDYTRITLGVPNLLEVSRFLRVNNLPFHDASEDVHG